nr:hypothetical protein [Tanacetum cinerariifolium]
MSNKRTSKRKPRIPKKFHDHIMGNRSHKKAGMEQFENVDEIRVYKGNSHEDKEECEDDSDENYNAGNEGMENVGENIMDDNVCNVSPSKPCLDDEINNADDNSQVSNDQFCPMNETNPVINEEPIENTKSYANIVQSNEIQLDTSLDFTPTVINEEGIEFVIFDDDIVAKGSEKWNPTICGHFMGCRMSENELRYNIIRMWSRYGLIDAQMDKHRICYFKFKNKEGMEEILAKGPWIVSNKPISLGKPIRMDKITAQNCKDGKGRAEYARVLVEFDVYKGFKKEICIKYKSKDNVIRGTKKVKVEYMRKPYICSQCKVFGHRDEKSSKFKRMSEGNEHDKMKNKESIDVEEVSGFTQVRYRKKFEAKRNDRIGINQWGGSKRNVWNNNGVYKEKDKAVGLNGMINYFKQKWEEDRLKEAEEKNEKNEDVLIGENIAAQRCSANDVNGEETSVLN